MKLVAHGLLLFGLAATVPPSAYGDRWTDEVHAVITTEESGSIGEQISQGFYKTQDPVGAINLLPKIHSNIDGPDGLYLLPDGTVRMHEVKWGRDGWRGRSSLWTEVTLAGRKVEVQQLDDRWINAWIERVRSAKPPSSIELNAAKHVERARREGRLLRVFDEVSGHAGEFRSSVVEPFAGALKFEERIAAVSVRDPANLSEYRRVFADRQIKRQLAGQVAVDAEAVFVSAEALRANGMAAYENVPELADLTGKRIVPGLLTAEGKLWVCLKTEAIEGGLVFATEAGIAGYRYVRGDTLRADFLTEVSDAAIKGAAVGSATAVAVVLAPAGPAGWIVAGLGIGTYMFVDSSLKTWHEYSNRKYVTLDDLKGFGVDVQSVFAQGGKLIPDSGPLVPSTPLLPTTSVLQPLGN